MGKNLNRSEDFGPKKMGVQVMDIIPNFMTIFSGNMLVSK